MNWSKQTVLVTGAGGFIGSHLVERLVELGARTRAMVRYTSHGRWGWLEESPVKDRIDVVAGDVRDASSVRSAVKGVDVVFHLAALIGIPYSYSAPQSYVETNVVGTLNILEAAREHGVARVVHTSTSEVYGTAKYVPIDEMHPLQGQSPYSATKIGADKLAEAFSNSFALPVATIRPFNTFGPRQSSRAVIPTIIHEALAGQVVKLGNLAPLRDFNYVADAVEGFVRMAEVDRAIGEVVNIGTGREISIAALADLIGSLMGKKIVCEQESARVRPDNSEVERLCADRRKAGDLLGWQPTFTLEDGLRRTISWIEQNQHQFRRGYYAV